MEAVKKGSRLIVIDPVKTEVARQAISGSDHDRGPTSP